MGKLVVSFVAGVLISLAFAGFAATQISSTVQVSCDSAGVLHLGVVRLPAP